MRTSDWRSGITVRPVAAALCLAAGPVIALAFTRFAYTLLLPPMRADLGWSFTVAGGVTTSNAAGYLLGAATTGLVARKLGEVRSFAAGMALGAVTLLLTGLTANYVVLTVIRAVGGYSTAVVFVVGATLAARIRVSSPKEGSRMVSIYMSGVGAGIVLCGIVIPLLLARLGDAGWRVGWLILGAVGMVLVPLAVYGTRQCELVAAQPARVGPVAFGLGRLFLWYALFGAGYVTYMTFVVALLKEAGLTGRAIAVFFVLLGVASIVGSLFVWGRVIHRLSTHAAPAVVSGVVAAGILPVLFTESIAGAFVSAAVFGMAFMAGPAAVTVVVKRTLPASVWTAAIAALTVAFSLGQAVGPVVSGMVADSRWGIEGGLWSSFALLILASAGMLTRRRARANGVR